MVERRIRLQPIGGPAPAPPMERCARTGKRRFPSREAAREQITAWQRTQPRDLSPNLRSYHCAACGGHHLTSQPRMTGA